MNGTGYSIETVINPGPDQYKLGICAWPGKT